MASNPTVEEFFKKLKPEMRRPRPSDDAIATALQAIQRLELESRENSEFVGRGSNETAASNPRPCPLCGCPNLARSSFCGECGAPLEAPTGGSETTAAPGTVPAAGGHHYHHHYHHHYFVGGSEGHLQGVGMGPAAPGGALKEPARPQVPLGASTLTRGEAAIRKLTQDWALACNTKGLDDVVTFYAADALVLRSNYPPVRGTASIREFFFAALDSGLGDVEMDALRVAVVGDMAYEAGRCKMLVPIAVGKRREERGKYAIVFQRQANGEWKAVVDCWSSDLNLKVTSETEPGRVAPGTPGSRIPRKSA